jgi:uncharacterized protein (TIGR03382 family)
LIAPLKIKPLLLGALLASPPLAAWALKHSDSKPGNTPAAPVSTETVARIPVEIVAEGAAPQWVQVEVQAAAVPEPGALPLVVLPLGLALLRRRR